MKFKGNALASFFLLKLGVLVVVGYMCSTFVEKRILLMIFNGEKK